MEDIFIVIYVETKSNNYCFAQVACETTRDKVIKDLIDKFNKKGKYFDFGTLIIPKKRLVSCEVMNKDEYEKWSKVNG